MLSVVIAIASAVMLIAGVAYAVFEYAPYVIQFYNSLTTAVSVLSSALPSWLLPFVGISLAFAVLGLLIKLL